MFLCIDFAWVCVMDLGEDLRSFFLQHFTNAIKISQFLQAPRYESRNFGYNILKSLNNKAVRSPLSQSRPKIQQLNNQNSYSTLSCPIYPSLDNLEEGKEMNVDNREVETIAKQSTDTGNKKQD
ncbi:hypothetical protein RCL_jg19958.t1 [Rhizophagus clarus]|uniref:Uncharacterized protein n=1 Tax=Rhizophagus clarus TaxID=94130 RepID=A0A8H3QKS8_9GLOM|nr:hypothetical protein RCL_jg19958.t1 [Rhizophagus clarus]